MLKKLFKFLLIIFILFMGAAIAIPVIYKDELIALVNEEANKSLNAKVEIGDVDLSFFSHFPSLSLDISNTSVQGIGNFEDVTLASVKNIDLELNVFKLISSNGISVQGIHIDEPSLHVKVLEDGSANYDITKPNEEEIIIEETDDGSSEMQFALESYSLNNATIIYEDASLDVACYINALNHSGRGNFTTSLFDLSTKTSIEALTINYEGVSYLSKVNTQLSAILGMDMDKMLFTFKDNALSLNNLPLAFEGWLAMPADDIDMDLTFSANNAGFKEALSLIPAIYQSDMEGLSAEGNFSLHGAVKGIYNDLSHPGIDFNLLVKNGLFKYSDLPEDVQNVNIDFSLFSPEGADLDRMRIDLKEFAAELAGNPFSASMQLSNPMSNPNIKAAANGVVDFSKLAALVPLPEGEEITGLLKTDIAFAGDMNSIEQEQYDNVSFNGNVALRAFSYTSSDLPESIGIEGLQLNATPKSIDLNQCDVTIGKSDLQATGSLNNFIAYALTDDGILKGNLDITSNLLDADAMMVSEEDVEDKTDTDSEEPLSLIEIPKNLDLSMNVDCKDVVYDDLHLKPVEGELLIKNGKAQLDGLHMGMLGGNVVLSGSYATPNANEGLVDFGLQLSNMGIQAFVQQFNTVEQLAPIVTFCEGIFNSKLTFAGTLDAFMNPVMSSLSGAGNFNSQTIGVKGFKPLDKLGDKLNLQEIKSQQLNDVAVDFSFEDGQLQVKPFDINLGKSKTKVSGSNTFDGGIDYTLAMQMPSKLVSGNSTLGSFLGGADGDLNLDVLIGGTVDQPKISTSMKGAVSNVVNQAKDKAKQKVEETKEQVNAEINKKIDALMAEAEKRAAQIREAGKKSAAAVRAEAKKQANKLIQEAGSNPIKKTAAELSAKKIIKEANKKADALEVEANKKANVVMEKAKVEADKLRR